MAGTATPLAPAPPSSVEADLFRAGTASFQQPTDKSEIGEMLPEQVLRFERESGVEVKFLIAAPGGPLLSMPSARPNEVQFGALNDPQYRLRQPIPLGVSVEESNVIVSWADVDEFGTGETLSAAISDFAYALRELHRFLQKSEELGPDLAKIKHVLGDYIETRPR